MQQISLISPATRQDVEQKRVAAYCRVSSNSADQLNSYANQINAYTKIIGSKPEWQMVEIFADEGISGMKANNRTEFQRMIRMCELHKIDLIITKSVSRFARNVPEALEYVRKLKLLGIGVQFDKEGINTLSLGDEMLLNTFSAIAQEESKSISQNQRLSIIKRMQDGEYFDSNAPYGFRYEDRNLIIYEPEAEIVKSIYTMYLRGCSTAEIARELNNRGIPSKMGGKWRSTKISFILRNEKYIGDSLYQKTYRDTTVPFKQFKNRGQEDRFYAKGTHSSLLDREIFEKVQTLLDSRTEAFAKSTVQNIYPLTSHIHCSECGSIFRRKIVGGTIKWVCAKHIEDTTACDSNYYSEERIYDGIITVINKLRFGEEDILGQILTRLETVTTLYKRNNIAAQEISQRIAELNAKLLMLGQLRSKGYLAAEVYQSQAREINGQLNKLKTDRQDTFESEIMAMQESIKRLKMLLDEIEEPLEDFDEKLFGEVVSDIVIYRNDEMTITMIGDLKFTEQI